MRTINYIIAITMVLLFTASYGANASPVASLSGGQLFHVDYVNDPFNTSGTFDFSVTSVSCAPGSTVFLNVVADIDGTPGISADEWVIQNVPMSSDNLQSTPLLSGWFDPGTLDISPGTEYDTWATIENAELTGFSGYPSWHYSRTAADDFIWGLEDPNGQSAALPSPSTATVTGATESFGPLKDVPDIAQKKNECGPTSAANSLRWLAKKHCFNDKLPANDDDLIKELMKEMTGSDARPFSGLIGDQLYDGKVKYIKNENLPLVVKGGNTDPSATGGKAYDFIKSELLEGEDVEFLIQWPGYTGSHWVTVVGYAVNGERLFIFVNDPDDKKTGTAIWELDKNGTFKSPKGKAMWAVSESFTKNEIPEFPTIALPIIAVLGLAFIFQRRKD
jgi:hypothetical protein